MDWRCEWCGKPHEDDDPPCDNCGHHSFEKAVQQINTEAVEGGPVWVCTNCGRQHQKNSPPCTRCGGTDFERRTGPPDEDPLDEIGTGWLDVLELKYVVGYAAVALLLGLIVLGVTGVVGLPGTGGDTTAGPPETRDAPGAGDQIEGLSLAAVEDAYLQRLNERRAAENVGEVTVNETVQEAATYYNKGRIATRYGGAEPPVRNLGERFGLACERPNLVAFEVAFDRTGRSVGDFDDETSFGQFLADTYVERGEPFRPAEVGSVGVDIHVAPDGRVFVTQIVC